MVRVFNNSDYILSTVICQILFIDYACPSRSFLISLIQFNQLNLLIHLTLSLFICTNYNAFKRRLFIFMKSEYGFVSFIFATGVVPQKFQIIIEEQSPKY